VSATADHAVVLVFVNQIITVDNDAPTNTSSSIKVSLQRVDGLWLRAAFDPI
jgi:Mce-associated membrane protein